jgi:integrase
LSLLDTAEDFAAMIRGPEEAARRIEDSEWADAEGRRALAEGELSDQKRLARCLRDQAGFSPEPIADDALARLLARAAIAAEQVHARRLRADYGARPKDPFFASVLEGGAPTLAATAPAKEPSGRTIADLEEAFRKTRFPALTPASQQGYEPVFRLLRDTLGARTALPLLTHDEGQELFEAVQAMPANAEKIAALKGRAVPDQIADAKRLGLPTISPKTINDRYMANLRALFKFAQDRGWMDRNPVQGLRAKELVGAADARDPFGSGLVKVFGAAPWNPKDITGGGRPIRYWGPLLALFHGLRLAEVAGLEIRDIGEETDSPIILIRSGQRQLKTAAAKRDIPLHPELVRLGFLKFVKARRKDAEPAALLFVGEKAFARDQWGRGLGDWFAKLVRSLGLQGRKLTFHSLRHDFRDALREAEVDAELADYLMGHARGGMGAVYGGRPSLQRLQAAIRKIAYAGLQLDQL